jgi:Ca2+-binding EF-hand superfamily protein
MVLDKIKSSYENTAEAFRAFDQRNKGKITKYDFIFALEQIKVKLSQKDSDLLFGYLD